MGKKFLQTSDGSCLKFSESSGETWVINETPTISQGLFQYNINFTSNGNNYTKLTLEFTVVSPPLEVYTYIYYMTSSTQIIAYDNGTWLSTEYRTITLESPATGDLLTWLQANAVKQESSDAANFLYVNE